MHPRQVPAKGSLRQFCLLLWAAQLLRQAGVGRGKGWGQPLPHSSHPSAVCCPEKLVRLPTGLQCTRAHLTTPRGRGRCSLTLRAWLQGRRQQSVPGRLHPIFITVTTGLVHKCPPTPFPNSRGSPLDSEAPGGTWGGKSRYLGLVSYPPQLDQPTHLFGGRSQRNFK